MNNPIDTLKHRLAAGEIDVAEYNKLFSVLNSSGVESTATIQSSKPCPEKLIAQVDNVCLFETYLEVDGKRRDFDEITDVFSDASEHTINLLPIIKQSSTSIHFQDSTILNFTEDRTIFAPKRHKQIRILGAALKHITFNRRVNDFARLLVTNGRVWVGSSGADAVYLTSAGTIIAGSREFEIKLCSKTGTFGIGTEGRFLNPAHRQYDLNEVVISNDKLGFIGFAKSSLIFKVTGDAEKHVLQWMAVPGNSLV